MRHKSRRTHGGHTEPQWGGVIVRIELSGRGSGPKPGPVARTPLTFDPVLESDSYCLEVSLDRPGEDEWKVSGDFISSPK